jgi:hypothetical protein
VLKKVGGDEVRRDPSGNAVPITIGMDRTDKCVGCFSPDGVMGCNVNEHKETFRLSPFLACRSRSVAEQSRDIDSVVICEPYES